MAERPVEDRYRIIEFRQPFEIADELKTRIAMRG